MGRDHALDSVCRLVRLPTYAPRPPWTNPVEKVWRQLYAEVLHLHHFADARDELTQTVQTVQTVQAVQAWLDQWREPAPALLRYVGFLCPS